MHFSWEKKTVNRQKKKPRIWTQKRAPDRETARGKGKVSSTHCVMLYLIFNELHTKKKKEKKERRKKKRSFLKFNACKFYANFVTIRFIAFSRVAKGKMAKNDWIKLRVGRNFCVASNESPMVRTFHYLRPKGK